MNGLHRIKEMTQINGLHKIEQMTQINGILGSIEILRCP